MRPGFQLLNQWITSMGKQRISDLGPRSLPSRAAVSAGRLPTWVFSSVGLWDRSQPLLVAAIAALLAVTSAHAQQVQYSQGFSGAGQNAGQNPAEAAAYSTAINQPNPVV